MSMHNEDKQNPYRGKGIYYTPPKHKEKPIISVVLLKPDEEHEHQYCMFFCNDCKNAIMQYKGEIISIIPGQTESEAPIIVQCSNQKCRRKYQFNYFAKPANE